MKTYYIHDGKMERGPFSLVELQGKITRDTPVWKLGLSTWTKASELKELKSLVSEHLSKGGHYRKENSSHNKKRGYLSRLLKLAGIAG